MEGESSVFGMPEVVEKAGMVHPPPMHYRV